jgi:hypothetical protein
LLKTISSFLDESGNYDFSPKGTSHLVYTAISSGQVHAGIEEIHALKHWLIACGQELEYFHATEDFQIVRDEVYKVICALPIRVDTIVVEKRKAGPSIRPIERLYPKMFEILLRYLLKGLPRQPDRIQIFAIRQTTRNLSAQWKRASNWPLRRWQAVSHILCCCTHQKAIRICKWRTIVAGQSTESGRDRTIGPTNSSCTWSKTSSMCFREESSAGIEIDPPSYPSRESPRALITRGVPLIHSHSAHYHTI